MQSLRIVINSKDKQMKNILTLILCLGGFVASAQDFSWSSAPADTTAGLSSDFEIVNSAYFHNDGDDTTFVWHRTSNLPNGWENTVCDINQCYGEKVDSAQFILPKGDSFKMKANFYANEIDGIGCITLEVISLVDRNNSVTRTFCAGTVTTAPLVRNNALRLFPNPASSEIQLDVEGTSSYDVSVVDFTGKVVYTATYTNTLGSIDISAWKSGMYSVSIVAEDFVANKTFFKQ